MLFSVNYSALIVSMGVNFEAILAGYRDEAIVNMNAITPIKTKSRTSIFTGKELIEISSCLSNYIYVHFFTSITFGTLPRYSAAVTRFLLSFFAVSQTSFVFSPQFFIMYIKFNLRNMPLCERVTEKISQEA